MSDEEREAPEKVRIAKLQEVQLPDVHRIELATAAMYHELGFDAAEVPVRSERDIAAMPRTHNVYVAEADYKVAGWFAFRDEEPGVAYVEEISVHPDYQRFGIGRRLFERMQSEARDLGLESIVLKVWEKATFATAFYEKLGLQPIDTAKGKARVWYEEKSAGQPLVKPGQRVLWISLDD